MDLVISYCIQILKIQFVFLGFTISLWEVLMFTIVASLVSYVIVGLFK